MLKKFTAPTGQSDHIAHRLWSKHLDPHNRHRSCDGQIPESLFFKGLSPLFSSVALYGVLTSTHVHVQASDAEGARQMMHGESESQKALHDFVPLFIPKPSNWGAYTDGETHFFLSEFIEMTDNIPPPPKVLYETGWAPFEEHGEILSPRGNFGFPLDTCQGNILRTNDWCDTWEKYFRMAMEEMIKRKQLTQGPYPEIDKLQKPLVVKVIPRLLRLLESNGRRIKPCLVHGYLWHSNTCVSSDTNEPYAFDSCALWAHNECM